jgi:lysophospholipase L1-like esterase
MRRQSPISRIVAAALLVLSLTACDILKNSDSPTAPTGPPAPGSFIVYTAVGASDAIGVGSSNVCVPFTNCPNGLGYVQVTARSLTSQGFTVSLSNLGLPTGVIGRDFQQLGQSLGRTIAGNFIDDEVPFVGTTSTVVTIFAGGNEVNLITSALGAGFGGTNQAGYIDAQVQAFGADFASLVSGIRAKASPRLVILNLPNMAGLPYLVSAPLAQRQAAQRAAVNMTTTVINSFQGSDVVIVDLMCDPRTYVPSNYSSDGFHPNDAGYAYIAGEVVSAISSSSYPPPRSSCSQMTIVP